MKQRQKTGDHVLRREAENSEAAWRYKKNPTIALNIISKKE